jgi:DNA repair protein RecO (recombination protein O)
MPLIKAEGLVINETNVGEAGKRLTLLLREHGKIFATSGSARKVGKTMAGSSLYCYSEFVLFKGLGFYNVCECEPIEQFYALRLSLSAVECAAFAAKAAAFTSPEGENADDVLSLLLYAFNELCKLNSPEDSLRVKSAFGLKLAAINGFLPDVSICAACGAILEENEGVFAESQGFYCRNHKRGMPVSPVAAAALRYITQARIQRTFSFRADNYVITEITKLADIFIRNIDVANLS